MVTAQDAVSNRREIPMKLTDTQLVLLSAASQREDGAIELAPNLKGGAAHKVVGKLLTARKSHRRDRTAWLGSEMGYRGWSLRLAGR